jgi:hypothetical protein
LGVESGYVTKPEVNMTASPSSKSLTVSALATGILLLGCGGKSSSYPDAVAPGSGGSSAGSGGRSAGSGGSPGTGTGGMASASGGAGGMIPPGDPIPIASFGNEYVNASCAAAARCGAYPTLASCLATNQVGGGFLTLQADVAAARVTYDPAKAATCLAAVRNGPCTVTASVAESANASACDGVFGGTVAVGGACFISGECAGTSICIPPAACATACCMGVCTAPVAANASCATAPCVEGTYCRQISTTTFRCTPQAATEGASCDAGDACKPPLFCALDAGGMTASCMKSLPGSGAACDPFTGCDDELQDYCNAQKVCSKRVAVGQACTVATETTPDNCVWYAYCDAGVCKAFGAPGAACLSDAEGNSNCLGAQTCAAPGMTCAAPPAPMSCR